MLFSGDTLFKNAHGRCDLPTGSINSIINSIQQKLFSLPDDVVVYPGHGISTTILEEKQNQDFEY
jgi:glyoxylase-like metal-dependent hydrolase (beta-lactamase superfamily II)